MKKILITGANSYIGTSFERYVRENYPDAAEIHTVDMLDGSWREQSFSGYDAVFHVAGIVHKKENKNQAELYYKVNRDLAIDVAKKAQASGVRQFIFLSTMSVYGLDNGVITENTVPKPKNNYGRSKLQAEQELVKLQNDSFAVAILRPPMVYGSGCKGNYNALRKLVLTLSVFPYVKNRRSMIYIENLCEFVRQTIDGNGSGIMFPQNSEYVITSEIAKCMGKFGNRRVRLIKGFGWLIKFCGLFVGKLRKAFGSLTYDKSMSGDLASYNVCDFAASIALTEIGK